MTRLSLLARWAALTLFGLPAVAQPAVSVEFATPGVAFSRPVGVEAAPGDADRLFVLEQGGTRSPSRVMTLAPGDAQATVYLDVTDRVATAAEAGLLGLAFHPGYAANGRVFVSYTAPPGAAGGVLTSRVSEFTRSATDPLAADPASERVILELPQPADNHNGGTIDFGPDGMLYVGFGDGGGGGDPFANGQDLTTLYGAILRIDVDDVPEDARYGIPPDNPFVGGTAGERPEIWAYGFRNPFKFDVDDAGLWAGDVGQDKWEEVNRVEAGGNYGWNRVEGPECFVSGCDPAAYRAPFLSYAHDAQGGFSVTGGFVYQDPHSTLGGYYLYGDFASGRLWGARAFGETGQPELILRTFPDGQGGQRRINVSSIDPSPDLQGVLVTDYGGTIYRAVPRATPTEPAPDGALAVTLAGPNPSRRGAAVRVVSVEPVRVRVFDIRGREVATLWDGPRPPDRLALPDLAPGLYLVRAETASAAGGLPVSVVR